MKKHLALVFAFVVGGSELSHAAVIAEVSCSARAGLSSTSFDNDYPDSGTASASCSESKSQNEQHGYSTAVSSAAYGILKAASSGGSDEFAGGSGFSRAAFSDQLLIDSSVYRGQTGTVRLGMNFRWNSTVLLGSSGTVVTSSTLSLSSGFRQSTRGYGYSVMTDTNGTTTYSENFIATNNWVEIPYDDQLFLDAAFIVGQPFSIYALLETVAGSAGNEGSFYAAMDAAHSAYWTGISSVTVGDNLIGNYSVSSASGLDYTRSYLPSTAIPEPGTSSLITIGLIGLISRFGSRHRWLMTKSYR
jgi:hypothetical protein